MTNHYIVIDVEASGLHWESFPISVAWGSSADAIEYHEIRPLAPWIDGGRGWNAEAEMIHGISLAHLLTFGASPDQVAERLSEALIGAVVYSDNPDYDEMWLAKLHAATGIASTYRIQHIARCLPKLYDPARNPVAFESLRDQAFVRSGAKQHTADGDVRALIEMIRIGGK